MNEGSVGLCSSGVVVVVASMEAVVWSCRWRWT